MERQVGNNCLMGERLYFEEINMFWNEKEVLVMQHCEVLNAAELHTLKWLILYYVNFISMGEKSIRRTQGYQ